ncbi:hypothetical protein ACOCEA_03165 [Maribacter sp. CXY002]|uniref:hypothetical protein n=1 Tax=Maribacter luteocoastalis TaxID=3407671 RepID=UPI003B6712AB
MRTIKQGHLVILLIVFYTNFSLKAQIIPGVYKAVDQNINHELKISDDYLIYSIYKKKPATFIKTVGGFYSIDDNTLKLIVAFNSNFEADAVRELNLPFSIIENGLKLTTTDSEIEFQKLESLSQDLDGQWLFATRGPDSGQKRRGEENARKTLKFLMDGRFQWIAYQTETMQFSGTGGGSFTSEDGIYTENIEYFSRDNTRVGATLKFNYEIKEKDWHHTGINSKGEPMYEIWTSRN